VADWQTISSLATAGGTLVLAVATFSAVRSSNRSARIAEQALLTGLRPLLLPSLADDPVQKIMWSDRHTVRLAGGRATFEEQDGVIYLAMGIRNAGFGDRPAARLVPEIRAGALQRPARRSRRLPAPHARSVRPRWGLGLLGGRRA
jgi:hypothetical protein